MSLPIGCALAALVALTAAAACAEEDDAPPPGQPGQPGAITDYDPPPTFAETGGGIDDDEPRTDRPIDVIAPPRGGCQRVTSFMLHENNHPIANAIVQRCAGSA